MWKILKFGQTLKLVTARKRSCGAGCGGGEGARVLSREVSVKVGAMSRVSIKGWFLKWVCHEGGSVKGGVPWRTVP